MKEPTVEEIRTLRHLDRNTAVETYACDRELYHDITDRIIELVKAGIPANLGMLQFVFYQNKPEKYNDKQNRKD